MKESYLQHTQATGQRFAEAAVGEGYLLLFDRRKEMGWDEKIYERMVERDGKRIGVFGA